jgi:hypothetical protein
MLRLCFDRIVGLLYKVFTKQYEKVNYYEDKILEHSKNKTSRKLIELNKAGCLVGGVIGELGQVISKKDNKKVKTNDGFRLRRHPKEELIKILNAQYEPKIIFHRKVIQSLLSKKVNNILFENFLQKINDLYDDNIIFRENGIQITNSLNMVELKVFKDWRIYIIPSGQSYIIYHFGHKNTQKKDISRFRKVVS